MVPALLLVFTTLARRVLPCGAPIFGRCLDAGDRLDAWFALASSPRCILQRGTGTKAFFLQLSLAPAGLSFDIKEIRRRLDFQCSGQTIRPIAPEGTAMLTKAIRAIRKHFKLFGILVLASVVTSACACPTCISMSLESDGREHISKSPSPVPVPSGGPARAYIATA